MLTLDLPRLMEDKGIENVNRFLVKAGFTRYTASRLLNNNVSSISFRHLEQLCLALHCSVEDLFTWKPVKNMVNADKHPLQKLKGRERKGNISDKLKELSPAKIEQLRNYLHQLDK